jgi:hypothetical protein
MQAFARRMSHKRARPSAAPERRMWAECGDHARLRMESVWPEREWVEAPERRSRRRMAGWDVPAATSRVDEGCVDVECVWAGRSKENVCAGTREEGVTENSFKVES